jgi:hypothetical protein
LVEVLSYQNLPGSAGPAEALAAWLGDRGIDWMPFAREAVRVDLCCGRSPDGHWDGWYSIKVRADELRRLGLHPDQGPRPGG